MTANATPRAVRSMMRRAQSHDKLNILTFCAHERYEQNLCRTGHNFYSVAMGKTWDTDYGAVPDNYHIIDSIPDYVDFDMVLSHTTCDRLAFAHNFLAKTEAATENRSGVPILRHTHVLPDVRFDVATQLNNFTAFPITQDTFISKYSMGAWGMGKSDAKFIEHGVDIDFWQPNPNMKRDNVCLSVVNDWPNRDWCCGWELWKKTIGPKKVRNGQGQQQSKQLPVNVVGKSPGLSEPAKSTEHLREIYQSSKIFYNTSLHSPVPTVLLEAMACGCAIVSTANCMIPEVIQHQHNGLISNDPNELRGFLEQLLKDDDLAEELGNNARKTIEAKYTLSRFVKNWDRILQSTVSEYKD